MHRILLITIFFLFTTCLYGQSTKKKRGKTIYKYRKYETFDFEDLKIEGETGSPGDLSIIPRLQRKFKNKLPYRKNFNAEIRKAIERTR